jgi:hypothetical protein
MTENRDPARWPRAEPCPTRTEAGPEARPLKPRPLPVERFVAPPAPVDPSPVPPCKRR